MNLFTWIIFGLITGLVTDILDPYPTSSGILGTIILGILGAVLGGLLGSLIFGVGVTGFNLSSFVVAILGSLLLVSVSKGSRAL